MIVFVISFTLVMLIYTAWLLWIFKGWKKLETPYFTDSEKPTDLSIIIPFRNESESIGSLLQSLLSQIPGDSNSEVILINDHSTDDSETLVLRAIEGRKNFHLRRLENLEGKKNATHEGILRSLNNWVITLDADVSISDSWYNTLAKHCATSNATLLILPVDMENNQTMFGQIQILEFLSIIAITGGTAGLKKPILCNGANLAFTRAAYDTSMLRRQDTHISSGDDVFLLADVKKHGTAVWIHDQRVKVSIQPEKSFSGFIQQRVRWASKTSQVQDLDLRLSSVLVFLTNMGMVILLALSFCDYSIIKILLIFLVFKSGLEYLLMNAVAHWLCKTRVMRFFVPLTLIYPFYATLIPLIGLFYKPNWKGRRIST